MVSKWYPKWYGRTMLVTMDRAGRIVIPKSVRDAMGLRVDESFELAVDGTAIRLEVTAVPSRVETASDGLPVFRSIGDPVLTAADVRAIRDSDQR
jgi:AbrB family looped-hinge helix DNA binding protein